MLYEQLMTCVWKGLIKGLECYKLIKNKTKEIDFATYIKKHNTKTINILINDSYLGEQEMTENYKAIENLNVNNIENGYMCSTSDPLLALVCQIYNINIIHKCKHTTVEYSYDNCTDFTLIVESSGCHFWIDLNQTQRLANRALRNKVKTYA
jgi:hypothetical protein